MIDKKKEKKLVGKHPNNYTMTKAVSEFVISNQASDLPVAIVRPSIGMILIMAPKLLKKRK